jgi:hypothetical protein
MSGGAINDSIILDFTIHINKIFSVTEAQAHVQPGLLFRDLDTIMIEKMLCSRLVQSLLTCARLAEW